MNAAQLRAGDEFHNPEGAMAGVFRVTQIIATTAASRVVVSAVQLATGRPVRFAWRGDRQVSLWTKGGESE